MTCPPGGLSGRAASPFAAGRRTVYRRNGVSGRRREERECDRVPRAGRAASPFAAGACGRPSGCGGALLLLRAGFWASKTLAPSQITNQRFVMTNRRKCVGHDGVPPAFRGKAGVFVTTCSAERHRNVPGTDHLGKAVLVAPRPSGRINPWQVGWRVLRPDRFHGLFRFPCDHAMTSAVRHGKPSVARNHGLPCPRTVFGRRLRPGEHGQAKAPYLLNHPARAGLAPAGRNGPSFHVNTVVSSCIRPPAGGEGTRRPTGPSLSWNCCSYPFAGVH